MLAYPTWLVPGVPNQLYYVNHDPDFSSIRAHIPWCLALGGKSVSLATSLLYEFFRGCSFSSYACAWFMYMNHDTIWLTGVRSQSKGTATALRLRSRRALPNSSLVRVPSKSPPAKNLVNEAKRRSLQKTRLIHYIFNGLVTPGHRTTTVSTKVIYPCMCNFEKLHLRTLCTKFRATVLSSS